MVWAPRGFPREAFSHRHHGIVIFWMVGDSAQRHDPGVKGAPRPGVFCVTVARGRRIRELPVSDTLHGGQDCGGSGWRSDAAVVGAQGNGRRQQSEGDQSQRTLKKSWANKEHCCERLLKLNSTNV